jgi:hypothetical protein
VICVPCRENEHGQCADLDRRENIRCGVIPLGHPADGAWCYCAHRSRECLEDPEENAVRAALRRHGYPDLPPRGVTGPPGETVNGYTSQAGWIRPCLLRNWVCVLDGILIDGHSDPDNTGMCVLCLEELP